MDALSIPAAGGVDTTALIIGDFSNGNDAVILKNKSALADVEGQNVKLRFTDTYMSAAAAGSL